MQISFSPSHSLSLSLSHTHTHTYTHTSFTEDFNYFPLPLGYKKKIISMDWPSFDLPYHAFFALYFSAILVLSQPFGFHPASGPSLCSSIGTKCFSLLQLPG